MSSNADFSTWLESRSFCYATKRVMRQAGQEARRFGRDYVGTEHLLLALARKRSGVTQNVLDLSFHLAPAHARRVAKKVAGTGSKLVDLHDLQFAPGVFDAIRKALAEVKIHRSECILPSHLLLALTTDPQCTAVQILKRLSVSPQGIHDQILYFRRPRSCCCKLRHRTPEEIETLQQEREERKEKHRQFLARLQPMTLERMWESNRYQRHPTGPGMVMKFILRLFSYDSIDRMTHFDLKTEAILNAMTPQERISPELIDANRIARIATGSGIHEEDVEMLLNILNDTNKRIQDAYDERRDF